MKTIAVTYTTRGFENSKYTIRDVTVELVVADDVAVSLTHVSVWVDFKANINRLEAVIENSELLKNRYYLKGSIREIEIVEES